MPRIDDETRELLARVQRKSRVGREGPLPAEGDVVACSGCGEPLVVSQRQHALLRRTVPEQDSMGRRPRPVRNLYHSDRCIRERKKRESKKKPRREGPPVYETMPAPRVLRPWSGSIV